MSVQGIFLSNQGIVGERQGDFAFSIEPLESLSITRPCRSLERDNNISSIMPVKVVASDSTAPVNG